MNAKTKTMDVPDIGGLLGKITDKRDRGELGVTERQHVTPVLTEKQKNKRTEEQNNVKPLNRKTASVLRRVKSESTSTGGRPTLKSPDVEYVRLGAQIPKVIKQQMKDALNYERFKTEEGVPITTVDELLTLALERLLKE